MLDIYKDNKWIQSIAHEVTNPFKSLPNFLIVGAQKAGTTSCYLYLREHPQIQMYCPKEVQFFSFNYHKGKKWYRSHAPLSSIIRQNTLLGEASPFYLLHPHTPRRIHQLMPSVKLIVLLRNPTTRAISHYFHNCRMTRNKETLPIMEALMAEEERVEKEWQKMIDDENYCSSIYQSFSYKKRGIYVEQLQRYYQYFNQEQILIINSKDFFSDTENTMKKILSFLEVDTNFKFNNLKAKNVGDGKKEVPKSVYSYLDNFFLPYNQELYEYTGTNFGW